MNLTISEARRLFLESQGLGAPSSNPGKEGLRSLISQLGYIQIDTLSVVARAHHHTLWSRIEDYKEQHLSDLLKERHLFEYWSHAASFLPMSDYRQSLYRKKMYSTGKIHWFREDNPKMKKQVLARIREEGPLQSRDFEHVRKGPGSWYEWKPAKRALEQLFMEGKLMVTERRNFQKVYDLAERVFPDGTGMKIPTEKEFCEKLVLQSVQANGLVTPSEMGYLRGHAKEGILKVVKNLVKQGRLSTLTLDGKDTYYADPEYVQRILASATGPSRIHILSPFDNAVIQRKRLQTLFGFDFFIECYVPEPKRKFGYFCLPVMQGDRFVARFDPKADRQNGVFYIKKWFSEKGWKPDTGFNEEFPIKLQAFAEFSGCERIICEKGIPREIKRLF